MLVEAISGIIAISIVFCCCTFCCYLFFQFLFAEAKPDVQPEPEPWEAKHYYDPLPLSTPSPPDTIFKPTPYTFKLQNGNGVYAAPLSHSMPHAVINPAVLQYPPGHVLDQQRVPPKHPYPAQTNKNEIKQRTPHPTRRRSRSRSPSPSPRGAKNVWSTKMEFQPTQNYNHHQQQHQYQRHHHHHPHPQLQHTQSQPESQRHYVQLTQEHYPVQPRQKHHHNQFPPEEFILKESNPQTYPRHQQHLPEAQYEPVVASTHATNIYNKHNQYDNDGHHHHDEHPKHHKHSRSHRSRHKEAVT